MRARTPNGSQSAFRTAGADFPIGSAILRETRSAPVSYLIGLSAQNRRTFLSGEADGGLDFPKVDQSWAHSDYAEQEWLIAFSRNEGIPHWREFARASIYVGWYPRKRRTMSQVPQGLTQPMSFAAVRTVRTLTSERFLLQSNAAEEGAVLDVHYLADGNVIGTVVILDDSLLTQETMQALMRFVDESLFPAVSFDEKTLSFTVVHGKMIGHFENEKHS